MVNEDRYDGHSFHYKQYDIFIVIIYNHIVLDHVYQCNNYVNNVTKEYDEL